MIVQIHETVFNSNNKAYLESLTKIIRMAFERRFLWNTDTLTMEDLEKTHWYENFLSNIEKESLEEEMNYIDTLSAYITQYHEHYLTKIIVSDISNPSYINPIEAYEVLNSNSYIVLENSINDWKFIEAIITKYEKHGKRKSIYQLLKKYLDNKWIEPVHAGGNGIVKILEQKINSGISPLKLITIFDSDKNSKSANLKQETIKLIEYLKKKTGEKIELYEYEADDLIVWHMLYKKELENYLPIEVINKKYTCKTHSHLSADELDFIDIEKNLISFTNNAEEQAFKNEFPNFFLEADVTKNQLEQRCEHHKVQIETPSEILEEVSEIEQILIKLAKII